MPRRRGGSSISAKWNLEVEYIQSCNCDYGCPCNFNGLPTHGNCEALVGYRVLDGKFNDTVLDDVVFAEGCWWPKAIHQGGGTGALYVDSNATDQQVAAIEEIFSGRHGGGFWEVFPRTWKKTHPTKRVKMDWSFRGHESHFKLDGIGECRSSHIKNPVTQEEFEGVIFLPHGITWKKADITNIEHWWLKDGDLNFDHKNVAGFTTIAKYDEKGCIL